MNITVDRKDHYVLAQVSGSIDNLTAEEFCRQVQPLMDQEDAVFLEMSATKYVNSDGLGRIIELHKSAKKKSKRFALISPSPLVRELLVTMRLDQYIRVADSVDSALQDVVAPAPRA